MNLYKLVCTFLFALLITWSNVGNAQEQLRPLSRNNNLPEIKQPHLLSHKTTSITPLNLPFFDDFSYADKSPYPSANNWIDSSVYVNSGFAIAPISFGVATFDGLNKLGYPYLMSAPVSYSGPADFLTSTHINLHSTSTQTYVPTDSIFLTFYYQAEGFGEAPEANDSLCLDFFKPNQNKWQKVWGAKGYDPSAADTNFYRVRVAIADTAYLDSAFQFRFRNKATISGSLDHWSIDYVQIKKQYAYSDTVENDVSFAYKPSSFLKNYSVIPYRQYFEPLEMAPKFRNYFRSNFSSPTDCKYVYIVKDETGAIIPTDPVSTFSAGINAYTSGGYYQGNESNPGFTLKPFPTSFTDSTFFTISHALFTSTDNKKFNDTVTHVQKFSNYYAYDDGTAELGYYLNAYGAKTAMRFTLNAADTLKSVRIYFDPIIEGGLIQSSTFRINVWANNGGSPGSLIYKDSLMNPTYLPGSYNKIPTYNLSSCLPLGVGTYFIGIQQTTNQKLNIGFDKNTNHKNALYYDIGNGWVQSAIPGSLMINPVMGCTYPEPVGIKERELKQKIQVSPNPAQNTITISYPGNQLEESTIEILTSLGQIVYTKSIISNETIDISNLSNGLYFIHLKGNSLNVSSQKLIISK